MSVCFLNSMLNGVYSNLLIVACFSSNSSDGKKSLLVKNLYLQTFPDHKVENLAVCLFKSY